MKKSIKMTVKTATINKQLCSTTFAGKENTMETVRQKKLSIIIGLAVIMLIVASVFASLYSTGEAVGVAAADVQWVTVTDSTVGEVPSRGSGATSNPYQIEQASHFVYAFTQADGLDKHYVLNVNVNVTGTKWYNDVSGKNFSGSLDGNGNEVTVSAVTNYVAESNNNSQRFGGLVGTLSGTIRNLTYTMNGSLTIKGSGYIGGMAGLFSGTIYTSTINVSGTVHIIGMEETGRNDSELMHSAGGIAGEANGILSDCKILISGTIQADSFETDDDSGVFSAVGALKNECASGGIAGITNGNFAMQGSQDLSSTTVTIGGSIISNYLFQDSGIGFFSGNPSVPYVAGGVVGKANGGNISTVTINISTNIISSIGGASSFDGGCIAGCVIGNKSGSFYFSNTMVNLSGGASACLPDGSISVGGIVGKVSNTSGTFRNVVINAPNGHSGLNTGAQGVDYEDNNNFGILAGEGSFSSWNQGNLWIVCNYSGGDNASGLVAGGTGSAGIYNVMRVWGGGEIVSSIDPTRGTITFRGNELTSYWYGFMTNNDDILLEDEYAVANGANTYSPGNSVSGQDIIALFMMNTIYYGGQFVRLAQDINGGMNFSWQKIELMNDVSIEVGIPPISRFQGTFNGNGHTVTFGKDAKIQSTTTAAMFGEITTTGSVSDLNIIFNGECTASQAYLSDALLDEAKADGNPHKSIAGVLAGVNNGRIANINLSITSGAKVSSVVVEDTQGSYAHSGGLIGENYGTVDNVTVELSGYVWSYSEVSTNETVSGGIVGYSYTGVSQGRNAPYQNIIINVTGEIRSYYPSGQSNENSYAGGFAGRSSTEGSYTLSISNVGISIAKESIYLGNTLIANAVGSIAATVGNVNNGAVWIVLDYGEYPNGLKLYNSVASSYVEDNDPVNRVFVRDGLSAISFNENYNQVFSVALGSNKVFAGWYTDSSFTQMFTESNDIGRFEGMIFTTADNYSDGKTIFSKMISSSINTQAQFEDLAIATNAGNDFLGVTFSQEATLTLSSTFTSIGNDENPFNGIFHGRNCGIVIDGISSETGGLFGHVGRHGAIYEVSVTVREGSEIINNSLTYPQTLPGDNRYFVGVLANINEGIIGSTTSLYHIVVNLEGGTQGVNIEGNVAGGLVGYNMANGMIINAQVVYDGLSGVNCNTNSVNYAGGFAGWNAGSIANSIALGSVTDNIGELSMVYANGANSYCGGFVGYNEGSVTSAIAKMSNYLAVMTRGTAGKVIGYNSSSNLSNVWGVSDFNSAIAAYSDSDSVCNLPAIGEGDYGDRIRSLTRYGEGHITVTMEISGSIVFSAVAGELKQDGSYYADGESDDEGHIFMRVNFYDFVTDLSTGGGLTNAEGVSGANLRVEPSTSSDNTEIFAVFADWEIRSANDFYRMANRVNSGFQAYVKYEQTQNYTVNLASADHVLAGTSQYPFIGEYKGNGHTVSFVGKVTENLANNVGAGLFNYCGTEKLPGNTKDLSVVQDLRVVLNYNSTLASQGDAIGSLIWHNYGTVKDIDATVFGRIVSTNTTGAAGGLVGYNAGTIRNCSIQLSVLTNINQTYCGTIAGYYSGALVGYNAGLIGDNVTTTNIEVILDARAIIGAAKDEVLGVVGGDHQIVNAVASEYVGGVVGYNSDTGVVYRTLLTLNGKMTGTILGGVVGDNHGIVSITQLQLNSSDIIGVEVFGGISGNNSGTVGYHASYNSSGDEDNISLNKVYINSALNGKIMGGIIGINSSVLSNTTLTINADMTATRTLGGFVAENVSNGDVKRCALTQKSKTTMQAVTLGGAAGINSAVLELSSIEINGSMKANVLGGIAATNQASATIKNIIVTINVAYDASSVFVAEGANAKGGLVSADDMGVKGVNVWAISVNNNRYTATANNNSNGYNTLKIIGLSDLTATISTDGEITIALRNTSVSTTGDGQFCEWYSDVSGYDITTNEGYMNDYEIAGVGHVFTPSADLSDVAYHVSYYTLEIETVEDFLAISQAVNLYDFFYGVKFTLVNDIVLDDVIMRPIGTASNQFTGIFEGARITPSAGVTVYPNISFTNGSVVGGVEHSALFGYTSAGSALRNFTVSYESDVRIGSISSLTAAGLVGVCEGTVSNVGVDFGIENVENIVASEGGLRASFVAQPIGNITNSWVIIYNGVAPATASRSGTGINSINILGEGDVNMQLSLVNSNYIFTFEVNATDGHSTNDFRGWYSDVRNMVRLVSGVTGTISSGVYTAVAGLSSLDYTACFIPLEISTESDFRSFVTNVNKFGANGAMFKLLNNIHISYSDYQSIGTREKPFDGVFDGSGKTISIGQDVRIYSSYAGVFGYVSNGAVIKDLYINSFSYVVERNFGGTIGAVTIDVLNRIVRRGNAVINESEIANFDAVIAEYMAELSYNRIGDLNSIYTGFLVSYCDGSIENVVVNLSRYTVLYSPNKVGALVGNFGANAQTNNVWVIQDETNSYNVANYVNEDSTQKPNEIFLAGEGGLSALFNASSSSYSIQFQATVTTSTFYGYVNKNNPAEIHASPNWSPTSDIRGETYIALFITKEIGNYTAVAGDSAETTAAKRMEKARADLRNFAMAINYGVNYSGIVVKQFCDIELSQEFVSIGGEIDNELVEFLGVYDGGGYTITVPSGFTIGGRYAGLFGITGLGSCIKNLRLVVNGNIGESNTLYAGALIGLNNGATLESVVVELSKDSVITATVEAGRMTGASLDTAEAINSWVLCYNSQFNYDKNESTSGDVRNLNVITIVGAGILNAVFNINDGGNTEYKIRFQGNIADIDWSYWDGTALTNDPSQDNVFIDYDASFVYVYVTSYNQSGGTIQNYNPKGVYLKASYLKENIESYEELLKIANDVKNNYDFFGVTFNLMNDIVISNQYTSADLKYVPIGFTPESAFNATFNGNGHSIILENGYEIDERYAGVFGYVGVSGIVTNLRLVINGTLGGKTTNYAGAVAYNRGRLINVAIVGFSTDENHEVTSTARLVASVAAGLGIGYDESNLVTNSWVVIDSANVLAKTGNNSIINSLTVVGWGINGVEVGFEDSDNDGSLEIVFSHDRSVSGFGVYGWYKSFAKDEELSSEQNAGSIGVDTVDGIETAYFIASPLIQSADYEMMVFAEAIDTEDKLMRLARDVNVGGYTFKNINFEISANITINRDFRSIGSEQRPFSGILTMATDADYVITLSNEAINSLFGYNSGEIRNLIVRVYGNLVSSSEIGAIANINGSDGVISGVKVYYDRIGSDVTGLSGITAGGLVGTNNGRISDCYVEVGAGVRIVGQQIAAGLVGRNTGTIWGYTYDTEKLNVLMLGTVIAGSANAQNSYAGGLVGISTGASAQIQRAQVALVNPNELTVKGTVTASGSNTYAGGLIGANRASRLSDSVCFGTDSIISSGESSRYAGAFIGESNANIINSWLVVRYITNVDYVAVGKGLSTINKLTITGAGIISARITASSGDILFVDATENESVILDDWYEAGTPVSDNNALGNVEVATVMPRKAGSFKPSRSLLGKNISVVYLTTDITSVTDLKNVISAVNNGISDKTIQFNLMNNLELNFTSFHSENADSIAHAMIGTQSNPFNNIFNGNGYTITIRLSLDTPSAGLFAYIGKEGKVRDLKVVLNAVSDDSSVITSFGSSSTDYAGGFVGYNEGEITDCLVEIGERVHVTGMFAGGFAGYNVGTISYSKAQIYNSATSPAVVIRGSVIATGGQNANSAGGIAGRNMTNGTISGLYLQLYSATIRASGTSNVYVGGLVGQNNGRVEYARLDISTSTGCRIEAINTGVLESYAGGLIGENMGSLYASFFKVGGNINIINASGNRKCYVGGLIASNTSSVVNVLIDKNSIASTINVPSSGAADIAIAKNAVGGATRIYNVWVYTSTKNDFSNDSLVSNITTTINNGRNLYYDVDSLVPASRNSSEMKFRYRIDASITDLVYYYNEAEEEGREVVDSRFLQYWKLPESSTQVYYAAFVPYGESVVGLRINVGLSNTIATESQFKSFVVAMNNPVALYKSGITFNIIDSFTLTGEYAAINSFTNILDGDGHTITLNNVDFTNGAYLICSNSGTVKNLILRLATGISGDNAAALISNNSASGAISNMVIYAEEGATVTGTGSGFFVATNEAISLPNLYFITHSVSDIDNNAKTIRIRNEGEIVVTYTNGSFEFRVVADENSQFVGWKKNVASAFDKTVTVTTEYFNVAVTTCQFISSNIYDERDWLDILSLIKQGMDSRGMEFLVMNDIEITNDISNIDGFSEVETSLFYGSINGNGHLLTLSGADGYAFCNIGENSSFRNFKIDAEGNMKLMMYHAGRLENIVIVSSNTEALYTAKIDQGENKNVYIFTDEDQTTAEIGVIYGNPDIDMELTITDDGIMLSAPLTATVTREGVEIPYIFAGWFRIEGTNNIRHSLHNQATLTQPSISLNNYRVVYVTTALSEAADLTALAVAVKAGFFTDEYYNAIPSGERSFELVNDIVINFSELNTIGDSQNYFAGVLNGNGNTITLQGTIATPLFAGNSGEITNLVVRYDDTAGLSSDLALLVGTNNGTITNIVLDANDATIEVGTRLTAITSHSQGAIVNNIYLMLQATHSDKVASTDYNNVMLVNGTVPSYNVLTDDEAIEFALALDKNFAVYTVNDVIALQDSVAQGYALSYSNNTAILRATNTYQGVAFAVYTVYASDKMTNSISSYQEWQVMARTANSGVAFDIITLDADFRIDESFIGIESFDGALYGNDHTITVASGITVSSGLTHTLNGSITRVIVDIFGTISAPIFATELGGAATINTNIAMYRESCSATAAISGSTALQLVNNWIIAYRSAVAEQYFNVLTVGVGLVEVSYSDADGAYVSIAEDTEEEYFVGYMLNNTPNVDKSFVMTSEKAPAVTYNVVKSIKTQDDWKSFVLASNTFDDVILADEDTRVEIAQKTIDIANDITLTDVSDVALDNNIITLNGGFHTITVDADLSASLLGVNQATVRNLAVTVTGIIADAINSKVLFSSISQNATVDNVVLASYDQNAEIGASTGVYNVRIGNENGKVEFNESENHFVIVAGQKANGLGYGVRNFTINGTPKYLDGTVDIDPTLVINEDIASGSLIEISFARLLKLFISPTLYEYDASTDSDKQSTLTLPVLPTVQLDGKNATYDGNKAFAYYWLDGSITIGTVATVSMLQGYMFAGFFVGDSEITADDYVSSQPIVKDDTHIGDEYEVIAKYYKINASGSRVTYNGSAQNITVDAVPASFYTEVNYYESVSGQEAHTNAGEYTVIVLTKRGDVEVGRQEVGLVIEPIVLNYTSLVIKDKLYDGTADAEVVSFELNGFVSGDTVDNIDFSLIKYQFSNSMAGNLYVSCQGTLRQQAQGYEYMNYVLPEGFLFTSSDGGLTTKMVTANIFRRNVYIEVSENALQENLGSFEYYHDGTLFALEYGFNKEIEQFIFNNAYVLYQNVDVESEEDFALSTYYVYNSSIGGFEVAEEYSASATYYSRLSRSRYRAVNIDAIAFALGTYFTRTNGIYSVATSFDASETYYVAVTESELLDSIDITGSLSRVDATNYNEGYYAITMGSLALNSNYNISMRVNASMVIKAREVVFTINQQQIQYLADAPDVEVTAYAIARINSFESGKVYYTLQNNVFTAVSAGASYDSNTVYYEIITDVMTLINARYDYVQGDIPSTYGASVLFVPSMNKNFKVSSLSNINVTSYNSEISYLIVNEAALSVGKRRLEVTVTSNLSSYYGAIETGFVSNVTVTDSLAIRIPRVVITRTDPNNKNAGEYRLLYTARYNNRDVTEYCEIIPAEDYHYTIIKPKVYITLEDTHITYGDSSNEEISGNIRYTHTVEANEAGLGAIEIRFRVDSAETYLPPNDNGYGINVENWTVNENYNVIFTNIADAKVYVAKRTIIAQISGMEKVYGESDPNVSEYTVTFNDRQAILDGITGTVGDVNRDSGEAVGAYRVVPSGILLGGDKKDYYTVSITEASNGSLTITKAPLSVVLSLQPNSFIYGDNNSSVSLSLAPGSTLAFVTDSLSSLDISHSDFNTLSVGEYSFTAASGSVKLFSVTVTSRNYEVTVVSSGASYDFAVLARVIKLQINSGLTKVDGEDDPQLVSITSDSQYSLASGDVLSITYDGSGVGSHTIDTESLKILSGRSDVASNYTVLWDESSLSNTIVVIAKETDPGTSEEPTDPEPADTDESLLDKYMFYIILGAVGLLLIVLICIIIAIVTAKNKKKNGGKGKKKKTKKSEEVQEAETEATEVTETEIEEEEESEESHIDEIDNFEKTALKTSTESTEETATPIVQEEIVEQPIVEEKVDETDDALGALLDTDTTQKTGAEVEKAVETKPESAKAIKAAEKAEKKELAKAEKEKAKKAKEGSQETKAETQQKDEKIEEPKVVDDNNADLDSEEWLKGIATMDLDLSMPDVAATNRKTEETPIVLTKSSARLIDEDDDEDYDDDTDDEEDDE